MTTKDKSGSGEGTGGEVKTSEKGAAKKKSSKQDKADKDLVAWALINLLNGINTLSPLGVAGERLLVCRADNGVPILVAHDESGVCRVVDKSYPTTLLMQFCASEEAKKCLQGMRPTKRWLDGINEDWVAMQRGVNIDDIKMVREKNEPGLCWRRLPYDLVDGPTPTFDEMMSRFDNSLALMAFIGSLFDEESTRQQYVWIFGEGRNGKGSLLNFLSRCLGNAYRPENSQLAFADKFWNTKLIGTRLMAFEDCDKPKIVNEGHFKMLTGGVDKIGMEYKGKSEFLQKVNTKFIFCSNDRPESKHSEANIRRAIYVESSPLAKGTPLLPTNVYVGQLEAEGAAFLWKCREEYAKYKSTGHIESKQERLLEVMEDAEERWEYLFNDYFVEEPGAEVDAGVFLNLVSAKDGPNLATYHIGAFKRWLERVKGIYKIRRWDDGKRVSSYPGIKLSEKSLGMGFSDTGKF